MTHPTSNEAGRCPSCDGRGAVGAPCPERVCARRGYHFVPAEHLDGAEAHPDEMVGRCVDEYLVVDVLGAGGFGKVYLALQLPIMLKAALKLMHKGGGDPAMEQVMLQKFLGEAQALARLAHPHVVRLLKYGVHAGAPYMVMEYVDGARTLKKELASRARRGEEMPLRDVRHILRQIVDGLDAAHAQHIVHRDIKPENIMLQRVAGNPDFVRILDFGLAKFVAERTETSMAMGTPMYMAPEQMIRRHIGPWTDLYAVGAVAFEMMTGRRPFAGDTAQEIVASKLDDAYDPMSRVSDLDVPEPAKAFFRRSMAKEVAARYQSAEDFRIAMNATFDALAAAHTPGMMSVDLTRLLTPSERLAEPSLPLARDTGPRATSTAPASEVAAPSRGARRSALPWMVAAAGVAVAVVALGLSLTGPAGESQTAAAPLGPVEPAVPPTTEAIAAVEAGVAVPDPAAEAVARDLAAARAAIADEDFPAADEALRRVFAVDVENDEARRLVDEVVKLRRARADAIVAIAREAAGEQRWDEATQLLDKAWAVQPGHEGAVLLRMQIDKALEDAAEVREVVAAAKEVAAEAAAAKAAAKAAADKAAADKAAAEKAAAARRAKEAAAAATAAAAEAPEKEVAAAGTCDAKAIAAVVRRHAATLRRCYETGLRSNASLTGRLTLKWTILTNGSVGSVVVASDTLRDAGVANCVKSIVSRMKFPQPRGGVCTLSYPFVFSPPD